MIPKNEKKLENEFKRCERSKSFVTIPKDSYLDYVKEAYSDLNSAEGELGKSDKWAIVKAYQGLFLMCNALLVKNLGYYSKDHGCVILGLLKNRIIDNETLQRISSILEKRDKLSQKEPFKNFFNKIDDIRILRNKYLYLPETQRKLKESPKDIIDEIKEIMKILNE